jgi:thiosulfate dehydrogenase
VEGFVVRAGTAMRDVFLGVVVTLLILGVGGFGFVLLGYMPSNADAVPSRIERIIAVRALDASMKRHAPHAANPVAPTDANLIEGMKIYTMNCAGCHGTLDKRPSPLEHCLYPPPPQFIRDPLDDPEWEIYYAVRTGVRYTGMPAWNNLLSEDEMGKVTLFISHIDKLPPAVQDYWRKSFNVGP